MRGIVRNHLLPAFGVQEIQSITRAQVKTFVVQKHQRYTPTYVRHLVRILHTILAQAVDEEILDRNPAAKLGRGLPEQRSTPRRDIHPFTSAELAHYLATVHAHYPQHYPYFLCLARTGMREGEALGLYWDDVQVGQDAQDPHRFLHIQRTYDPVHRLFNTPKNGRSRRVDMSQELRRALLDLRHQRFDTAVLHGATTIPQVVFCGTEGRPLSAAGLYKIHQRVCARAGLRGNRIHDLRHSYATIQLYEYHAPIQYVSEQLGHASIKITVDIYGHPRQGTSIALADRLDSAAGTALGWNARQSATSAQPQKTCRAKSIEISNG
jgi:integrase